MVGIMAVTGEAATGAIAAAATGAVITAAINHRKKRLFLSFPKKASGGSWFTWTRHVFVP